MTVAGRIGRRHGPLLLAALLCAPAAVHARPSLVEPTWNLRLRHEQVDDDAIALGASASTLRLRAGLRLTLGDGWTALVEGEGIVNAGDEFNSGANGRSMYPAVIDPEGAELNQAWIGWHDTRFAAVLGRQRILLDNQRWVGNVGWRQNEQTFDALTTEWKPNDALTFRADWLASVQKFNGDRALDVLARERDLDTHLFNLDFKHSKQHLIGYAYLHRDNDVAAASSATYGLRWTGDLSAEGSGWAWALEAAQQRDYGNSPLDYSHGYWLIEPAYSIRGTTLKLGWEHLGGNGVHALQTPLATLHAFDGWADKLTVTPAGGLDDRYFSLGGKFGHVRGGKYAWTVAYHDFQSASANASLDDYGSEWDASVGLPLAKGLQALVKLADYRSAGYARDTSKIWLQLEWASAK